MKKKLKLKSKSGIHRLVTGLEERGFIRRLAHKARALEVIRLQKTSLEKNLNTRVLIQLLLTMIILSNGPTSRILKLMR